MDGKSIRILMITPFFSPNIGGVETHLDDLCEYLRKRGHKIFVITYQPLTTNVKAPQFERAQNLEIRRIGWFGYNLFNKLEPHPLLEFIYLTPMLLLCSLFFVLRNGKNIDIVHAHGLNAAFIARVLTRIHKKRFVTTIHAIYNLNKKPVLAKMFKLALSSSNAILAIASKSKTELVHIGLDDKKIRVFRHWVNQEKFKPLDKEWYKKKLGCDDKFVVLFVGRFLEIKGIRLLLEVAKVFQLPKLCFAFVGEGPLAREIQEAKRLGNIIFLGRVSEKQLIEWYNAADLVIVPSVYAEAFGRVILEALSCGTPVLASKVGGISEALDPTVGFLIEPRLNNFEEKIKEVYHNPKQLAEMSRRCREYATSRFSENNARVIEETYFRGE